MAAGRMLDPGALALLEAVGMARDQGDDVGQPVNMGVRASKLSRIS